MNCREGDLAVYVGADGRDVGRLVTCLSLIFWDGKPAWLVDPPLTPWPGHRHDAALDASLRPIRHPGEDARDNAWDWLPAVPTKELA